MPGVAGADAFQVVALAQLADDGLAPAALASDSSWRALDVTRLATWRRQRMHTVLVELLDQHSSTVVPVGQYPHAGTLLIRWSQVRILPGTRFHLLVSSQQLE